MSNDLPQFLNPTERTLRSDFDLARRERLLSVVTALAAVTDATRLFDELAGTAAEDTQAFDEAIAYREKGVVILRRLMDTTDAATKRPDADDPQHRE